MKLVLLGTTGYHPSERRQTACFFLPEIGVVLDAGTGMFRVRDHLATETLDVFLTHAHLDHVIGLTYYYDLVHERPLRQIRVHGEAEKLAAIREHLFAKPLFPVLPPLEFRPLAESVTLARGGRLTHFPLVHPGGSIGLRLDWPDRSLAYVTDTTARADANYVATIRGVDVLIHECNFTDGAEELAELTGHSCLTPVAEVARAAGVGRLILVHMNPLVDADEPFDLTAARRIFPRIEQGRDGQIIEF